LLGYEDFEYFEGNVIQWNQVFGNLITDSSLKPTYKNLALEEAKEILEGVQKGDRELILDGIADSLFTVNYWCNLNGYFFKSDDIKPLVEGLWTKEEYIKGLKYPFSYYAKEMVKAINEDDPMMAQEYLLLTVVTSQEHYDIAGAFNRVLESNYSKSALKSEVDVSSECAKIEEQGRYSDIFTEEKEGRIIFRSKRDGKEGKTFDKGKIVKPSTFKDVEDLGGLKEFCL